MTLSCSGLPPNTDVAVVVHSDPVTLGSYTSDGNGALTVSFSTAGLDAGSHNVTIAGVGVDVSVSFNVGAAGSTTTLPAVASGTGDYVASCTNSVTPDLSNLTFHITASAPTSVTSGTPVSLTNQSWRLDVPGSVLSAGINLGLLNPGDTVAGTVSPAVFASNTAEGTQTAPDVPVAIGPISVDAVTGAADNASSTFAVPDMTWTPAGGTIGYTFAETTAKVTIGPLKITFTCSPDPAATPFLTTEVTGAATTIIIAASAGVATTAAAVVLGTSLPRTGYSPTWQLVFALTIIDIGYLVWSVSREPRTRRRTT